MHEQVTYIGRSVEPRHAGLAVDAGRVVTAAHAHSAPSELPVNVQAERQICHRLIKVAFLRLAVAVTLWKHTQSRLVGCRTTADGIC